MSHGSGSYWLNYISHYGGGRTTFWNKNTLSWRPFSCKLSKSAALFIVIGRKLKRISVADVRHLYNTLWKALLTLILTLRVQQNSLHKQTQLGFWSVEWNRCSSPSSCFMVLGIQLASATFSSGMWTATSFQQCGVTHSQWVGQSVSLWHVSKAVHSVWPISFKAAPALHLLHLPHSEMTLICFFFCPWIKRAETQTAPHCNHTVV